MCLAAFCLPKIMALYINPESGSDSDDGSILSPLKTYKKAEAIRTANDNVYLRGGTYREVFNVSRGLASANNPYRIEAYNGEPAVIDGEDTWPIDGDEGRPKGKYHHTSVVKGGKGFVYTGLININQCAYVELHDLRITRSRGRGVVMSGVSNRNRTPGFVWDGGQIDNVRNQMITFFDSTNVTVKNGTFFRGGLWAPFSRSGGQSLFWNPAFVFKETDTIFIHHNLLHSYWGEGWGFARGSDIEFHHNVVYDVYAVQVYFNRSPNMLVHNNFVYHLHGANNDPNGYDYLRNGDAPPAFVVNNESEIVNRPPTDNLTMYNNVGVAGQVGLAYWGSQNTAPNLRNHLIVNNTFVNARANGGSPTALAINSANTYQNCVLANNVFHQTTGNMMTGTTAGWSRYSNSWTSTPPSKVRGSGDVYGDVKLENPDVVLTPNMTLDDMANFKLKTNSPAIRKGSTRYITTDAFGNVRSVPDDLGMHSRTNDGTAPTGDINANFTATPLSITDAENVDFTDSSTATNTITAWSWERNSGSGWAEFSTIEDPQDVSFAVGTWSIRLTVTSSDGSDTLTKTSYIVVTAAGGGGGSPQAGEPLYIAAQSMNTDGSDNTITWDGMTETPAAILIIATKATADNTAADGASKSVGVAVPGGNSWAVGVGDEHSSGTTDSYRSSKSARCVLLIDPVNGDAIAEGHLESAGGGTATIAWDTTPTAAYKFIAVAFSADAAYANTYSAPSSGSTSVPVGGVDPKLTIFYSNGKAIGETKANASLTVGMLLKDGTQGVVSWDSRDNKASSEINAYADTAYGAAHIHSASVKNGQTFSSISSSGITATTDGTGISGMDVGYLVLDVPYALYLAFVDSATSTGNEDYTPSFKTGGGLIVGTYLDALASVEDTDDAASVAFGAFTASGGHSAAITADDSAGTSNTQSLFSTSALDVPLASGADGLKASPTSTDDTKITFNYSATNGTARKQMLLLMQGPDDVVVVDEENEENDIVSVPLGFAGNLPVYVDSAQTGQTPTATISENGASFSATGLTPSEIGDGYYSVSKSGGFSTGGPLVILITAGGVTGRKTFFVDDTSLKVEHLPRVADHVWRRDHKTVEASTDLDLDDAGKRNGLELAARVGVNRLTRDNGTGDIKTHRTDDTTERETYSVTPEGGNVSDIDPDSAA